jgi:hypothetical protein
MSNSLKEGLNMDNQPRFIALRCETCGGNLDVPKQNVVGKGDDEFTITGSDVFACQHCGTRYLPQQSLERFTSTSGIVIAGDVVGGDVIFGDKVGGDVIHSSKVVFQQVQASDDVEEPARLQKTSRRVSDEIEEPAQQQKISKKWWQFWK